MIINSGEETNTSNSFEPLESYVMSSKSSNETKKPSQSVTSKIPTSSSKKNTRTRSKTCNEINLSDLNKPSYDRPASASILENVKPNKSETCLRKNKKEVGEGKNNIMSEGKEAQNASQEIRTDTSISKEPSEIFFDVFEENPLCGANTTEKSKRRKSPSPIRKPSEIPKLKTIVKTSLKNHQKTNCQNSKLPVKSAKKEPEQIPSEPSAEMQKTTPQIPDKILVRSPKGKKNEKEKKLKETIKEDFSHLVPLYESELKKISDVWVNTIYCSLTMRTNLVKFLFNAFPQIDRSQFYTEDEKLLYCIDRTKIYTKAEAENLIRFIKSLISNREKAKEEYALMASNREIAESYNYDWKDLTKKIAELGEKTKQLQLETPELQKKKEDIKITGNEKLKKIESSINTKVEEIQKLVNQLNILKHREKSYKGNVFLNLQDYKDIKGDVVSLASAQKEFEELRANYKYQNDMYEKKIKALETLLEEKKKDLEKTKEVKRQLQAFLVQLQEQQKRLATKIGKEPLEYVMGRSPQGRNKRREQLWITAINLVLKGFLIQMKKLERDRNKMLLELQSNDPDNLNALASVIIQKNNFIKNINHQMNTYYKASKCSQLNQDNWKKEN